MNTGLKYVVACLFALALLSLFSLQTVAQSTYTGIVLDTESRHPVPYAHVVLAAAPGRGTITNASGRFYFRRKASMPNPVEMRFSSMGYESATFPVYAGKTDTFLLAPAAHGLAEVVVTPEDYERNLLRRLIARIPINHPTHNERLIGEVVERGFGDTLNARPLYEARAITLADKQGYHRRSDYGNVAVLEGTVDTFPDFVHANLRISAGAYNVHRFDVVQLRRGPLNERRLMDYSFESLEMQSFDGHPIQPIRFTGNDLKGLIYINMTDTAIYEVDVEVQRRAFDSFGQGISFGSRRSYLTFQTGYAKFDGLYRLKYIHYNTAFASGVRGGRFFLENTYAINVFEITDEPISHMDRVGFNDRLTDLVILNNRTASGDTLVVQGARLTTQFERVLSRISSEVGYFGMFYTRDERTYSGTDPDWPEELSGTLPAQDGYLHGVSYQMNFRLNGRFSVIWNSGGLFSKMYNQQALGLQLTQSIGFAARWTIRLAAAIGVETFNAELADIGEAAQYPVLNREIGFKNTSMSYLTENFFASPILSVGFAPKRNLRFSLSAMYIAPFAGESYLLFNNEDFSWPWQKSRYRVRQPDDNPYMGRLQLQFRLAFGSF